MDIKQRMVLVNSFLLSFSTKTILKKMNVTMPIVESLYKILYEGSSSDELIQDLLDHPNEVDVEFTYKD